jgi:hypothetical protein
MSPGRISVKKKTAAETATRVTSARNRPRDDEPEDHG